MTRVISGIRMPSCRALTWRLATSMGMPWRSAISCESFRSAAVRVAMTSLSMRRRSAPRICSSCPHSDAESGGRTRRVSTAIPGVAIARRASRFCASGGSTIGAPSKTSRSGEPTDACDRRVKSGPLPQHEASRNRSAKVGRLERQRPRDISAVFDEHIDVHPARPGESLAGGCVENSR